MTTQEFSNQFDVLLNSYTSIGQFGKEDIVPFKLDEYEKSVFLTDAQEQIVLEVYSGRNLDHKAFEQTEEYREYISSLVKTVILTQPIDGIESKIDDKSTFYQLPNDVLFITYESVTITDDSECLNQSTLVVKPITQDQYFYTIRNPFKRPSANKALRLDYSQSIKEIICKYPITAYFVKYLSKPSPIVLTNLGEDINIDGINVETPCMLNSALHRTILERAVKLALNAKSLYSNNK